MILPRKFYLRPTLQVAQDLLGKYLVYKSKSAKIIEVEAYIGQNDLACHASHGKTKRNQAMFLEGGHIYIYLIYGIYHCLNIVTGKKDNPEAVLIRALGKEGCDGPGKLCRKFSLNKNHNGLDLTKWPIYIEDRGEKVPPKDIGRAPRIGVDYAGKWAKKPWRLFIKNSPYLSTRSNNSGKGN